MYSIYPRAEEENSCTDVDYCKIEGNERSRMANSRDGTEAHAAASGTRSGFSK